MSEIKRARPSPTIMVAMIALVVALGGSAVAEVATTSLSKKQVKKIAKQQAKKQVKRQFPVVESQIADGAVSGAKVADGALGTAKFAGSIPAVRATNSANQSIPSSTTTTLAFDSERYDTANVHANSTDNSRLTAPVDGIYAVTAQVGWSASTTGTLQLFLDANDDRIAVDDAVPTTLPFRQEVTTQVSLEAGDYVEARVYQSSGGALSVSKVDQYTPEFSMTWLAPGP